MEPRQPPQPEQCEDPDSMSFLVCMEQNAQPMDRPRFFILAEDIAWIALTATAREKKRVSDVFGIDMHRQPQLDWLKVQAKPWSAAERVTEAPVRPGRVLIHPWHCQWLHLRQTVLVNGWSSFLV